MSGRGILLPLAVGGGAENMAIDQALLEAVEETQLPVLRFYQWREPTLSLGYFQRLSDRVLHPPSSNLAVVRRATGGGAIVHHRELTYSIVLPITSSDTAARLRLYQAMHRSLATALADQGIRIAADADVGGRLGDEESFLCFQRRSDTDMLYHGYKILGSAQRRTRRAVLQHGSLLLRASPQAPECPGLADFAPNSICAAAVSQQWAAAVGQALHVQWLPGRLSEAQRRRATEIAQERFDNHAWTHRR